jgi:3-oxoadipate enol-lactonase
LKEHINGIDLAYDDHGVGQPIFFLHAFPLNRHMWDYQMRTLLDEQRFRLVALDWRGFGESDIAADISTMEDFADDVAALMDHLGMQQAILCTLSMGGYVAFAFQRKYPQRINGLILADTKPQADSEEVKANREQTAQLALEQGTEAIANLQIPRLLSAYTREHYPDIEVSVRHMINAALPKGIAAASRGMAQRTDATDLLGSIHCPSLVLVGEHDSVTPPELVRAYADQIPDAQFTVIPQAGHLSNIEQPQAFTTTVKNFLHSAW